VRNRWKLEERGRYYCWKKIADLSKFTFCPNQEEYESRQLLMEEASKFLLLEKIVRLFAKRRWEMGGLSLEILIP
jgi:hypothetical protein